MIQSAYFLLGLGIGSLLSFVAMIAILRLAFDARNLKSPGNQQAQKNSDDYLAELRNRNNLLDRQNDILEVIMKEAGK